MNLMKALLGGFAFIRIGAKRGLNNDNKIRNIHDNDNDNIDDRNRSESKNE